MDYTPLTKKLVLPRGCAAPRTLTYEDLVATALSRAHLRDDVRGINASLDLIRQTRGGPWPAGPVTEDYDLVDLMWHECEFREEYSFSYALYTTAGEYLGCAYLYPLGRRTPLTAELSTRCGRQLVGHTGRLRTRLLRESLRGAPALDRTRLSRLARVLLEPRDSGLEPAARLGGRPASRPTVLEAGWDDLDGLGEPAFQGFRLRRRRIPRVPSRSNGWTSRGVCANWNLEGCHAERSEAAETVLRPRSLRPLSRPQADSSWSSTPPLVAAAARPPVFRA